jgi:hypothetical protein
VIKKYPRTRAGYLRRTSRIYLTKTNAGKVAALRMFLLFYTNVVNYFIEFFWSAKNFTPALADKVSTARAVNRFKITARLAQCAAKQAKETVRSQKERQLKRMPVLRRKVATLDARFVKIESYKGYAFDLALLFGSGLPKMTILLNATEHLNRLCQAWWRSANRSALG